LLVQYLASQDIEVRGHARRAPRFDAGWSWEGAVYIAEVKSLSGVSEEQQRNSLVAGSSSAGRTVDLGTGRS
jgi:hypothetical protein